MTTLVDIGWLLPQTRFLGPGNAMTGLSKVFFHDGRLLGAISNEAQRRYGSSRRTKHAAVQDDLSRLIELLEYCTPDAPSLSAALEGGHVASARMLLGKGAKACDALRLLPRSMSDEAVAASGTLLRELCARPDVSRTTAMLVGVYCGLLDVIACSRDGAFNENGFTADAKNDDFDIDFVNNEVLPRNAAVARVLTEHPFFSLEECFTLAASANMRHPFPGSDEWVNELCLRLIGDADTPRNRSVALSAAAATGATTSIAGLLARGAEFEEFGCGSSGLMLAAEFGQHAALRRLYLTRDSSGNNLFACVAAGLTDCAKDLIRRHNWRPNDFHQDMECTLLSLACARGDVETVRMLLQHGASADTAERSLGSPADPWLMCLYPTREFWSPCGSFRPSVKRKDQSAIAQLLRLYGSRPTAKVIAEAAKGCFVLLKEFIGVHGEGAAVVLSAALPLAETKRAVRRLLRVGATVGCAELIPACKRHRIPACVVVAMLAAPGACLVNVRDSQGRTALTWAALSANPELVTALLGAGADVASADDEGNTALALALLAQPEGVDAYPACKKFWMERMAIVVRTLQIATPLPPPLE